jgi:cytochrome-b5 reductase
MIKATDIGLPAGMDVEALVLTITAGVVTLIILLDLFAKSQRPKKALDAKAPNKKVALKLAEKIELSHDTHLFRFGLQSPEHILGLPVGRAGALSTTFVVVRQNASN